MTALRTKIAAAALAVGTGAGLAAALPGGTAVAAYSPPLFLDLLLGGPGHLVARGAGVEVPAEVTCTPGATAYVTVRLTQAVDGTIARGAGFAEIGCTGGRLDVLVTVVARNRPFGVGKALVSGSVDVCIPEGCGTETDQRTIRIRK